MTKFTKILAGATALATSIITPAMAQSLAVSPAFTQGNADRQGWEVWFNGLAAGPYRDGALFWTGERSKPNPAPCYAQGGRDLGAWSSGCVAAQVRLAPTDARRKSEPDYRLGWNSWSASPAVALNAPPTLTPPQAAPPTPTPPPQAAPTTTPVAQAQASAPATGMSSSQHAQANEEYAMLFSSSWFTFDLPNGTCWQPGVTPQEANDYIKQIGHVSDVNYYREHGSVYSIIVQDLSNKKDYAFFPDKKTCDLFLWAAKDKGLIKAQN